MFGLKRYKMIKGGIKLSNEELHNLNSSKNMIRVINSRKITWPGNVPRMEAKRIDIAFW
jgi:hypothetical protein